MTVWWYLIIDLNFHFFLDNDVGHFSCACCPNFFCEVSIQIFCTSFNELSIFLLSCHSFILIHSARPSNGGYRTTANKRLSVRLCVFVSWCFWHFLAFRALVLEAGIPPWASLLRVQALVPASRCPWWTSSAHWILALAAMGVWAAVRRSLPFYQMWASEFLWEFYFYFWMCILATHPYVSSCPIKPTLMIPVQPHRSTSPKYVSVQHWKLSRGWESTVSFVSLYVSVSI